MSRIRVVTLGGVAGALLLAGTAARAAGEASPPRFPLMDRSPFSAILGIPGGWTDPGGPAAEISWDIASHAMAQQSGGETLMLDGETHALTLRLQRTVRERLSLGVELPWITHGGGFLDQVIDDWHDTFGLSEGIRPSLPTGDLRFAYYRDGTEVFSLDDTTSGIGDLRTSAAFRLAGAGAARLVLDVTASVEWPTGDAGRLTGSGGTDLAAGIRLAAPVSETGRLGWAVSGGLTWPGDVDLPLPPSGRILYYDASLAWAALQSLDLVLQVQGHSGGYQSDLRMLGTTALQFGGGAVWRISPRYSLRFGVFEDIRTDTTPDFATELSLVFRPAS